MWGIRRGCLLDRIGWMQSGFGPREGVDHRGVFGSRAAACRAGGFHIGSVLCDREAHPRRLGSR